LEKGGEKKKTQSKFNTRDANVLATAAVYFKGKEKKTHEKAIEEAGGVWERS